MTTHFCNLGNRFFTFKSTFIFYSFSYISYVCLNISTNSHFENLTLLVIVANSVMMCIQDPTEAEVPKNYIYYKGTLNTRNI